MRVIELLLLICFVFVASVQATYVTQKKINFHSDSSGTTDGRGGNNEGSFFFDLDNTAIHKSMSLAPSFAYQGQSTVKVYLFVRRNSPFPPNQSVDDYIGLCSMQPSPALNLYDCDYMQVKKQAVPTTDSNITFPFPRPGRWYAMFVADTQHATADITVHVELSKDDCTGTLGGPFCDKPIKAIAMNGPDSDVQTGEALADSYKLFSIDVPRGVAQLFVLFQDVVGGDGDNPQQDYSGLYMRYGSTPNIYERQGEEGTWVLADLGFLNFTVQSANWLAPPSGRFYIAVYGGESSKGAVKRKFSFKIHMEVCSKTKNGGFCNERRHTVDKALCPKPASKTCQAPDQEAPIHRPVTATVIERSWQYMHFSLPSDGYRLRVATKITNFKSGDQLEVVVNPNGVPEHNGEDPDNQIFVLADVYPNYMEIKDDEVNEIVMYYPSTQNQMIYYIGLWTEGSRDIDVELEVKWDICPNNCSSNGTCSTEDAVCFCNDEINTVDCASGIPTPPPANPSSKPLSLGAIIALSICIPLAVIIIVTLIAIGAYTYHKRRNEYVEIA